MVITIKGESVKNLILLRKAINLGCTSVAEFAIFLQEYSKAENNKIVKVANSSLPTLYKKTKNAVNLQNNIYKKYAI